MDFALVQIIWIVRFLNLNVDYFSNVFKTQARRSFKLSNSVHSFDHSNQIHPFEYVLRFMIKIIKMYSSIGHWHINKFAIVFDTVLYGDCIEF
jgi:hypothetical protein